MKKLYSILFFLLIFQCGYSQLQILYGSISFCESSEPYQNLTENVQIVGNPSDYTLTYSGSDLNGSEVFQISNPEQYALYFSQIIQVSCVNNITQETTSGSFICYVMPLPVATPASLTFCSDTELPIYNLDDAIPQLTGGLPDLQVTFFYDASTTTPIPEGPFVPTEFPVQTLWARLTNMTGCSETTTITLHTNDCSPPQPCVAPTTLSVSNITQTRVTLFWMAPNTTNFSVYLTPQGGLGPNEGTTGIYYSVVSNMTPRSFVVTSLLPGTWYSFYMRSECGQNNSAWIGPFNFCTMPDCENNGVCPDHLALISFVDANNNGTKDTGEVAFDMGTFDYQVNNNGTILHGYSNNGNPFRIFPNNPNDAYDLSFLVNAELAPYFSCSTTYNDIHIAAGSGSQTFYFPVEQLQAYQDLVVDIVPSGAPRPGFAYVNYIKYKNKGVSTITSGTVYFLKDDALTISSASPSASNTFANGISLDFTNLAPQEERTIIITLQVPTIPTVNLGQSLTNTAIIEPALTDSFPLNNTDLTTQLIVGSYDPNLKTEAHGGKVAMDTFTTEDDLTYTVQFENTGTASAEFIRVEDILDAGLNPDTVEMLSASHPYNMRRIGNKLVWNFYNINLPTTASNPAQSHGYVQFKVKPTAGYAVGTMIPNAADIYFDYNPAIVTDRFETHFVETLSNDVFANNAFFMAPNPANSIVRLGWKDSEASIENIEIRDVLGKSILKIQPSSSEIAVDVSSFSKGIYFVEMTTKSQLKITKKLIVN